jgi:hypothetical protein
VLVLRNEHVIVFHPPVNQPVCQPATMKISYFSTLFFAAGSVCSTVGKRDDGGTWEDGQPSDGKGRGGPILGMPDIVFAKFNI